jgi:AcrR family transcriptional regulator
LRAKKTPETATGASKRLPKAERRQQLLNVARAMVRTEGTDALTLVSLAERAQVTRPITYEHFKTRSGLLIALARSIDASEMVMIRDSLARAKPRLADVARAASEAYMRCVMTIGPEWQAIVAALQGDDEMDAVQREILEQYAELFRVALAPCTKLSKADLKRRCVAIVGAAEALARELLLGQLDEATAAATLGSLIVAWLG